MDYTGKSPRKTFSLNIKNAVMPLVLINVVVFILQLVIGMRFTANFALVSADLLSRPWILLTHMFLHSPNSMNHIFFNMFGLLMFGPILEQRIGAKRFLLIYLVSGLLAGLLSSFFYRSALGASAALMGILGVLIILMPQLRLLFFFVIPMPLWVAGIIWTALDAFGIFFPTGVGNIAHLAGLGCGLIYGLILKNQKKEFHKRFRKKEHIDANDLDEYMRSGRI